ncbi:MAG: F0F1 ATP synthase subunit delta [Lysobacterales bacterium]
MSSNATLARPYARAAFELAQGAQALGEWARQIEIAATLARDARLGALLIDPRRSQAEAVALLLPPEAPADGAFADFLRALGASGRLRVLPEIAVQFEALKRDAEGTLKVKVRSAVPLDDAQLASLKASLARRFSRDVEIDTAVDADLIGGAIIEAGETVIDGSVRGRLARLAQELTH